MRITLVLSSVAFLIACGPPPEDDPIYGPRNGGTTVYATGGVTASGGVVPENTGGSPATGGVPVTPSGGTTNTGGAPLATGGGTTKTGGSAKTGGSVAATGGNFNPFDGGSVVPSGGVSTATGGIVARTGGTTIPGGTGGTTPVGGAAAGTYNFGAGDEPCANPKDVSLKTPELGTGASCYRTADEIQGWGASNFEGRTLKVNRVAVVIPAATGGNPPALPPKLGSFYYFDISEGTLSYASMYWYGLARPIPTCGSFPAWVSGATNVAPCATP